MKHLRLDNTSFRYVEQSFKEWLSVQGYSESTVYYLPLHIREFLHYLEAEEVKHIGAINNQHIRGYYEQLKQRPNKKGGGLSNAHLNKHIQALRKFTEYLRKVGRLDAPAVGLKDEEAIRKLDYLSVTEIKELFKATYHLPERKPNASEKIYEAVQSRDRAMLAIYYGCGLRRNEGVQLAVEDINFDSGILHVKSGKNYKERLVPISKANLQYLTSYVYDHRPVLSHQGRAGKLFVSYSSGKGIQGQSLLLRLKKLQYYTGNHELIEKEVGLHTLRHSIATHLLQAGMSLENISRFLGHSSLESTQIYTHLAGVKQEMKQPYHNIPKYEHIQLSEDE
jgi:integrase/recombinase XerD